MATSTEPKLKVPGESTTKPSFATPQVQTAPDVATSQKIAGIAPIPNQTATPTPLPGLPGNVTAQPATSGAPGSRGNPTGGEPQAPTPPAPSAPAAPTSTPETTNYQAPAAPVPLPTAGQAPTVPTSTGAPPGVPNTTAILPTPVLAPPKALEGHNAAANELITAENQHNQELYEAALKFNGGPDSALEQDRLRAEQGLKTSTANRGAAGTINSSLYAGDKSQISTAQATANLKAYNVYQEETNKANDAMQKAETAYQRATESERREIAEAAERREAKEQAAAVSATPTTVAAGTPILGAANPKPPGPPPPGKEWTPSGKGGWVPIGTKVVRTY